MIEVQEVKHFLDLAEFDKDILSKILISGVQSKLGEADLSSILTGKTVLMMFEKPSTRTRVSLETAVKQMGGQTVVLNPADSQLGRGESVADTARVLSRYVDAIALRTHDHDKILELAKFSSVPVVNLLSNWSHPTQLIADLITLYERFGDLSSLKVAWSGDGNNVLHSWMHAAAKFGFELQIACPEERMPDVAAVSWVREKGANVSITNDSTAAVAGADAVVTDVWISMGDEQQGGALQKMLQPYRVDENLMSKAKPTAIFMHCLPAKRGQEVTDAVLDGQQSAAWDEAENRLHANKGILFWCLS
jgi:ornithine carbamoyltransferase